MKTQALESHLYKNRKDATDDFKNQRGVGNQNRFRENVPLTKKYKSEYTREYGMQGHDRRDTHCTINLLNNKYSISVFSQQLRGCKLKQIKTTITSGWW
jgi:hypothetical protein